MVIQITTRKATYNCYAQIVMGKQKRIVVAIKQENGNSCGGNGIQMEKRGDSVNIVLMPP